jgi:hypothetical protein
MQYKDINNKLNKVNSLCGTLKRTMKHKRRREAAMKFYKVITPSVLLYGSETRAVKRKDINRMQTTEMGYLRSVKGFTRTDQGIKKS